MFSSTSVALSGNGSEGSRRCKTQRRIKISLGHGVVTLRRLTPERCCCCCFSRGTVKRDIKNLGHSKMELGCGHP